MEVTDKLYHIWENQEKFEDIKEVVNQIEEGQKKKDKQRSTKHYTEN